MATHIHAAKIEIVEFDLTSTIDALINEPETLMPRLKKINAAYLEERQKIQDDENIPVMQIYNHYDSLIKKFLKKDPLFFFDECSLTKKSRCKFSRYNFPHIRRSFENTVVQRLEENFILGKEIKYVSFASGDLFSDLVIMTKFLTNRSNAQVSVHLIDRSYKNIAYVHYVLGKKTEIIKDKPLFIGEHLRSCILSLHQLQPQIDPFIIMQNIQGDTLLYNTRF